MNAHTLHLPEGRGVSRWSIAGLTVLFAHAVLIAGVVFWSTRRPPAEPNMIPAITVTLAPVEASSPEIQDQDIAIGPAMQQAEEVPQEPPKQEKPVEQVEQPPPPQQQAEVTLPQEAPKQVEQPKPEPEPPAPETRAPPKTQHIGQFSQASANAYNALVFGHLQRFKRYPAAARGASGTVTVRFELNRAGDVIDSEVAKTSGNAVLDHEALDLLQRASPFPAFPAAKPQARDSYLAPVSFAR
ncbi:energy transducer TonB [Bradyrhizobium diazoefficiens]|uniref:energy transducer TonB family protein n=1 Tax=Bradyrhizobium diazoefficiens TaxID=1355477 RepID=UPI00190A807D|nr:energy transducer TonB [Bradyrhizobium diazoefficiens]MBK3665207.1 energy transducer TonB [Bradyrhizobium diazoefficiens]